MLKCEYQTKTKDGMHFLKESEVIDFGGNPYKKKVWINYENTT
jgi:hypothetical protein